MALAAIHDRLTEHGVLNYLQLLPSHDSMRWVNEPSESEISPKALVIGKWQNHDIVASLIRRGEKPLELRFVTGSEATHNYKHLSAEQLMGMRLFAPFNYLQGPSKIEKWRVSCFIKYYFMEAKWISEERIGGDVSDMAKKFQVGLKIIWEKKVERKKRIGKGKQVIEESEEDEEEEDDEAEEQEEEKEDDRRSSPVGVRTRSTRDVQTSPLARDEGVAKSDYDKLKCHLRNHNELFLLENIPTADEMSFEDQYLVPKALEKKLLVGMIRGSEDKIYAYMRFTNNFHEIRFISEGSKNQNLNAEAFTHQQVLHPFNKTFPKDASNIDQGDKARATLIIKWYFIEAGIAKSLVLKETQDYPNRFRQALAYIADRMGSAAVKPPVESSSTLDHRLDESDIQSTLGSRLSPTSPPKPSKRRHSNLQQPTPEVSASVSASSNEQPTRKRTTEDAELDDIERTIAEDRALTKEMNEMDDMIDLRRMQLQALEEGREKMNEARKGVRKRLRRQSLAFARSADDE